MGMKRKTAKLFLLIIIILFAALVSASCRAQVKTGRDTDGSLEPQYHNDHESDTGKDFPSALSEDRYLVPVAVGKGYEFLFGFADRKGNIVIEPRFKSVEPFYDCGVATVTTTDGCVGLIDGKGNFLVEPVYSHIHYSEGLFIAYDTGKYTTIVFDEKGNRIFETGDYLYKFSEGLAPLQGPNERGYIDKTGKLVLPAEYGVLGQFVNGMAKVSNKFGDPSFYIDKSGNILTDTVSSGLSMYKDDNTGLFGYKDNKGEIVIPAQFAEAEPFLNGYAIVAARTDTGRTSGIAYGVIDTQGSFVISPEHSGIKRMKNGIFSVGEKYDPGNYVPPDLAYEYGKKAVFSPDARQLSGWQYYIVNDFDDKYICASDGKTVAFYDSSFNKAEYLPEFEGCGFFERDGNLLRGELNYTKTVSSLDGEILTGSGKDVLLGDGISSRIEVYSPAFASNFAYPVIEGLEDKNLESRINNLIRNRLADGFRNLAGSVFATTIFDTDYTINRVNNLLIIDHKVNEYVFGAVHGSSWRNIVYIDLRDGRSYESITQLIKPGMLDEALSVLSRAVSDQMKENPDMYWEDHVDITPDVNFVLKENRISVYFDEYEIAAYAAGMPEFFVPYSAIREYIDTTGSFWQAFNRVP